MIRAVQRTRQRGQALVEGVIMIGVVIMLFLGIFYLGKFHDVQASTIQAARYGAWERTVHSPGAMNDTRIQNQARARLFTWNEQPLKGTDGLANGKAWTAQSAGWRDHSPGRNRAATRLIARPDDVVLNTRTGPLPGLATETISKGFGAVTGALDGITGGEALPQGGTVTGNVSVRLNNIAALPKPLDKLNLTLRESSSVMTEGWDASGPDQAARRSRTFTLAGPLSQIKGVLNPIEEVLSWIEPAFDDLHFGQVCPDIVPADRVEGGNVLPAYRGGGACVQ